MDAHGNKEDQQTGVPHDTLGTGDTQELLGQCVKLLLQAGMVVLRIIVLVT